MTFKARVYYSNTIANQVVAVPFGYLSKNFVMVYADGAPVDNAHVTWHSDSSLSVPVAATSLAIIRATKADAMMHLIQTGTISPPDINVDNNQLLNLIQELEDADARTLVVPDGSPLDPISYVISLIGQSYQGAAEAVFATTLVLLGTFGAASALPNGYTVVTAGRDAVGDLGHGRFYYKSTDTTTADNGGTIRVDAQGRRWFAIEEDGKVVANLWSMKTDGTDSVASINAALATTKNVKIRGTGYTIGGASTVGGDTILMTTAYQTLEGDGEWATLSVVPRAGSTKPTIKFDATVSGGSRMRLRKLAISASSADVGTLVEHSAPMCVIDSCRLISSGGNQVIDCPDEGGGKFSFGLHITGATHIYANMTTGKFAIRYGNNSQDTRIDPGCYIENFGTAIQITSACQNVVFNGVTFEDGVDRVFDFDAPSGGLISAVSITGCYFENIKKILRQSRGNFQAINFKNNYAVIAGTPSGSIFYESGNGASAASANVLLMEGNYIDGFETIFALNYEYTSRVRQTGPNTFINYTTYASGTYADQAYKKRWINSYFVGKITGTPDTATPIRISTAGGALTVETWLDLANHTYLDFIRYKQISVAGTTLTVTLHSIDQTTNTDTTLATSAHTVDGTYQLAFGGYPDPNLYYYMKAVFAAAGSGAFLYPYEAMERA